MSFKEYDRYDGLGLAELVRKKEVTPDELLAEAFARTDAGNPRINAVNLKMYDEATRTLRAGLPEGPFTGVPFLLKDLHHAYAGVPMSNGCEAMRNYVPEHDSELVKRFKATGVVVFGKTSTPELGLLGYTEPEAFGPTRNPWNPDHTPGGSSGGSGAAVAAGFAPMASASDGGGSIRIPASACALFGLKPSRGRVPVGPEHGEVWHGASSNHVVTRSVRDSAAMLDAIAGHEPGGRYSTPAPAGPYLAEIAREPRKLRIALNTVSPIGKGEHPEAVAAARNAARLLEGLGHVVEEARPDVDGHRLAQAYLTMYMGQVAVDLRWIAQELGKDALERVEPITRLFGVLGEALPAAEYLALLREWNTFARAMADFYRKYDLYLTPTMAYPPVRVGELRPKPAEILAAKIVTRLRAGRLVLATGAIEKLAEESLTRTPFTQLANLTGLPAMSVPLHWTPEGLPIGAQFIGPFADEATLLQVASQLEKAQPWFDRRPPSLSRP